MTETVSIALDDLSLNELVQLNQGLGHQNEKLRAQRQHLNAKIAERLARGERNQPSAADGVAPGAILQAGTA